MIREARIKRRAIVPDITETWASFLQRRVMDLLLVLDPQLFRHQFRVFYTSSDVARHPLLQFYDQHIKLLALSQDILDDILPRISLQWSQLTEYTIVQEEDPMQGQVDWQRTLERASSQTPGQVPLSFAIRQRQQHNALPENLLTVALLLQHRQLVHEILRVDQQEEILMSQERQFLITIEERLEHELAQSQIHILAEEAQRGDVTILVEQVKLQLHPGPNPYRDLLEWWEHFSVLQRASAATTARLSFASSHRQNEEMDLWLYELWIALELISFLQEQNALVPDTLTMVMDQLSFIFTWNERRYRFRYQRRGLTGTEVTHHWEQMPAVQSSYLIERDDPLIVEYKGKRNWQEPPVVVDVAYTAHNGEAMQRLLGNMTVQATAIGFLISPYGTDPTMDMQRSGEAHYQLQMYSNRVQETHIELYKIMPDMPLVQLQECLQAILHQVIANLPERPQPICCGVVLDKDSSNASGRMLQNGYDVLCPKPHIGPDVYDLVSRERHCLQDPRLCHVIGQTIIIPQVKRVTNLDDLKQHIEQLGRYGEATLKQAEKEKDEEKAEQFRTLILQQAGEMIEQYVRMRGNTALQEKFLRDGIFGEYWNKHNYQLEPDTCNILISGEYVWDEYQNIQLDDWAAPAVQYCRALEREIKRRFYTPVQAEYLTKAKSWTLGSIKSMYADGHPSPANKDWQAFTKRAFAFGISEEVLIQQFVEPMVKKEKISDVRNTVAHGQRIDNATAIQLRNAILGERRQEGLLTWVVRNIGPEVNKVAQ
jgi:hypothetical protein